MTTLETHTAAAKKARDDLATTLDAIEGKLNVPKRVAESYQQNRMPWLIGGAIAAAVVIGTIAWAIFSDD